MTCRRTYHAHTSAYFTPLALFVQAFRAYGATDARVITDRESGRSKGFGK